MFGSAAALFLLAIFPQDPDVVRASPQARPPQPPLAVTGDTAKAKASLGLAGISLRWNQFGPARQNIEAAIAAVPAGSTLGVEARSLLDSSFALEATQKVSRHQASLDEAERLLDDDKYDAASQIIAAVVKETEMPAVLARGDSLLARSHPSTLRRIGSKGFTVLFGGLEWLIGLAGVFLLLSLAYVLLRLVKGALHGRMEKRRWEVYEISDGTSTGASGLVLDAFARRNEAHASSGAGGRITAGLLTLEELAAPSVRVAIVTPPQIDLTAALDGIPAVAGVAPSAVAKGVTVVRQWLRFRPPWIRGAVTVVGTKLVIRLTRQKTNESSPAIVTASADAASPEAAAAAAEEVVAKMYYLIGKDSSVVEAEASVLVEQGIALMRQYLVGADGASLPEAWKRFAQARSKAPTLADAQLYEGVALDLLEQHDEAIQRFSFLRKQAADRNDEVSKKALYNEAIARFRKYQRPEFANAVGLLDELITPKPDLAASPIAAFALAAKANVYAHYLIFWDGIPDAPRKTDDPDEITRRKQAHQADVAKWLKEVWEWTEQVKKVDTSGTLWDATARQQLSWAIQNARGNAYLNYAIGYLALPSPPGKLPDVAELKGPTLGDLRKPGELQKLEDFRTNCLEEAQKLFLQCAQLFPRGVEVLTNMATVASELGKFDDARRYARQAIDVNPRYEYAYYRLAQTWQKQNRRDKVIEVLELFKKQRPPRIHGFLEMYKDNYIRPSDE